MATSFDLINTALDGRLEETLREMRGRGLSVRAIREHFKAQGFEVGAETVRRWLKRLGIPLRSVA